MEADWEVTEEREAYGAIDRLVCITAGLPVIWVSSNDPGVLALGSTGGYNCLLIAILVKRGKGLRFLSKKRSECSLFLRVLQVSMLLTSSVLSGSSSHISNRLSP